MSFDKNSNFNKEANFQTVKFGENKPVLEVELNELQEIQNEARADIVRDSIPSGFTKLGELDYDYMLNNENQVRLKSDSIAYVNGYRINIPKDTIINIGKAPEKDPREDLVFLEVWKEEVTKDSTLTKNGGEGQATIPNTILDSRYPVETTRRVALKWRLRHVADVDFSKAPQGLDYYGTITVNGVKKFPVDVQGALSEPYVSAHWAYAFRLSNYYTSKGTILDSPEYFYDMNDMGLFVSGKKGDPTFKTVDGFVYAIPMFRIYRKPSCGKSIPFEYNKINPLVNYTKFHNLITEDRVERIYKDSINGKSLLNLMPLNYTSGSGSPTNTKLENGLKCVATKEGSMVLGCTAEMLKSSTSYTLVCNANLSVNKIDIIHQTPSNSYLTLGSIYNGKNFVKITTNGEPIKNLIMGVLTAIPIGTYIEITDCVLLEGDWSNKEINYFTGFKSLGENEGNLITVKNGILNDSSYDPDTGNAKLNTVKGVNYINSENSLVPTIEAQVKRGDTKLSDVTKFEKIDNLVGDEVIEFTTIKGKTLQNLVTLVNKTTTTYSPIITSTLLRPNTVYTLFATNSVTEKYKCYFNESITVSTPFSGLNKGLNIIKFTTPSTIVDVVVKNSEGNANFTLANVMILEGDFTLTPISYQRGISSVGETENNKILVTRTGKNLLDNSIKFVGATGNIISENGKYIIPKDTPTGWFILDTTLKLKPNTKYTFSAKDFYNCGARFALSYVKGAFVSLDVNNINESIKSDYTFTTDLSGRPVYLAICTDSGYTTARPRVEFNIQIEEGSTATEYTNEIYKQKITLKEPLRSLPNGVFDTIEGNKVIRRVGKVVLKGSESWLLRTEAISDTTLLFQCSNSSMVRNSDLICDQFITSSQDLWGRDIEGIKVYPTSDFFHIRIAKSKLTTPDVAGFKSWLSKNPTTVYYELANPYKEKIEPNYDKESIKTYQLSEPLRSLSYEVQDEIINNVLYRRCGEIILNGTESWTLVPNYTESNKCLYVQTTVLKGLKVDGASKFLSCDRFVSVRDLLEDSEGIANNTTNGFIYLRIDKSKLDTPDVDGFIKWLKANPTKVIYERANYLEMPLQEASSSKFDSTYNRQFKYSDNYLLELPNGVKDTVDNNKIQRRLKKLTLNGSENWAVNNTITLTNTMGFCLATSPTIKLNTPYICDKFKFAGDGYALVNTDVEGVYSQVSTPNIYIRINKTRLDTQDVVGFKAWLAKNPIQVIYELATPVQEALNGVNNRYVPRHPINTHCGSLYVGNGTNDIFIDGVIKSPSIEINTSFRQGTNKLVVSDCNYKKHPDGLELIPSGKRNLVPNPTVVNTDKWTLKSNTSLDKNTLSPNGYNSFKVVVSGLSSPSYLGGMIDLQPNKVYGGRKYKVSCYVLVKDTSTVDEGIACELKGKKPGSSTIESIITIPKSTGLVNNSWVKFEKVLTIPNTYTNVYLSFFVIKNGVAWFSEFDVREINSDEEINAPFEDFILTQKAVQSVQKNDLEDLRHLVSLTGFNYTQMLNESFDKLLRGDL